jgi:hypothetical protein
MKYRWKASDARILQVSEVDHARFAATLRARFIAPGAKTNADLLKAGQFGQLDIEHLLDELSDMDRSEQRALESCLRVLLAHLLRWQF